MEESVDNAFHHVAWVSRSWWDDFWFW